MNAGYLFAVTPARWMLILPAVVGLLLAIAFVVKVMLYVLERLDGVYAFVGAVGRWLGA